MMYGGSLCSFSVVLDEMMILKAKKSIVRDDDALIC